MHKLTGGRGARLASGAHSVVDVATGLKLCFLVTADPLQMIVEPHCEPTSDGLKVFVLHSLPRRLGQLLRRRVRRLNATELVGRVPIFEVLFS